MTEYVIEKIYSLKTDEDWDMLHDTYYQMLKDGIEHKEVRRKGIEFQLEEGGFTYELPLTNFITNVKIWRNIHIIIDGFEERHILDCVDLNMSRIKDYMDRNIVLPYRKVITNKKMNILCAEIIEDLKKMVQDFSDILGLNLSLYDEVKFMKKNDEYRDLLNSKLTDDMTQDEIDEYRETRTQRIVEIIKSDIEHPLHSVLVTGEGISIKQFTEMNIAIGSKPDGEGNIYPRTVKTNFLNDGIQSVGDYFIESTAGINAKTLAKTSTGDAGYYSRQITLLNSNTLLHPNKDYDCGNESFVTYTCDNMKKINKVKYRYYKLNKCNKEWKQVKYKDESLLGKTILLRSAMDCNCEDGYVCWKCYGDLAYVNSEIHIGILSASLYTEKLTQKILSAKHLFTTLFKSIEWNDNFEDNCEMNSNIIHVLVDDSKVKVKIKQDDLYVEEDMTTMDNDFYVDRFFIVYEDGNEYPITNKESKPLYLTDFCKDVIGEERLLQTDYDIVVDATKNEFGLFAVNLETVQLSETFNELKNITNSKKNLKGHTYKTLFRKIIGLLIEGGIRCDAIHLELIIRNLIRKSGKNNIIEVPDFKNLKEEDYQLVTVKTALWKNPAIGISLSFDSLSRELKNPLTYKKTESSLMDSFFRITINKNN